MATFFRPTPFRRFVAALLSALLSLGPVATPAYAAVTALADEPLAVRNQSKPNIMMTVDDSTSMLYDFLPDYVIDGYCRSGSGKMDALCGYGGSVYDFTAAVPTGGKYCSPRATSTSSSTCRTRRMSAPPAPSTSAARAPAANSSIRHFAARPASTRRPAAPTSSA